MLLFCDGMDHYNLTQLPSKWDLGTSMLYSATGGRFGGGTIYHDNSNFEKSTNKTITPGTTFIIGFAYKIDTAMPAAATSIVRLFDSGTVQTELRLGTLGQLSVFTNGSQVGSASANGLITLNTWNFIEWKVSISASTGANECVVRVNNVEVLNLTGVATKTTSNTTANQLGIGRIVSTQFGGYYDDVYVLDNTGSQNNDLLGDCRIETLYPGAAGNYTQLTANGAATNWQAASEHPADDDTSYVSGNSAGLIDSYAMTDPVGTITTVFAVQVNMRARKDNAGTRTIARLFRSGVTDFVGSDNALGTSYSLYREILELNPATSAAWTSSQIAGMEMGVKVTN